MRVKNMTGRTGRPVANQFIIDEAIVEVAGKMHRGEMFQSYRSNIALRCYSGNVYTGIVLLDKTYWDYSVTTGRYRNQFLGESKAETERKIASGLYKLVDLNT